VKFAANQHRTWGKPDSEGVVEHVRDDTARTALGAHGEGE
jgi:hypothetical protein